MLDQLKSQYETYLEKNSFKGNPTKLYDSMNYIMQLGGKRIRSILTLLGAKVAGGEITSALPIAHALEVFHNFTLVHDDIMDKAPTRRGKETLHIKENIATAILAGDNMLIAAYDIVLKSEVKNKDEILEILSQTAREICEGQQLDMDFEDHDFVGLETYIEMIRLKTAVLLGCCLKCGSLSAQNNSQINDALYNFGMNAGIAFQIMDDYLDAFGDPKLTGKQTGGDIIAGKKTALFNLAYEKATKEEKSKLLTWFDFKQSNAQIRLENTLQLFHSLGIAQVATELMESYFNKSKEALLNSTLSNEKTNQVLKVITYLRGRSF